MTNISQRDFERIDPKKPPETERESAAKPYWRETLSFLLRDKLALASAVCVLTITLCAVFAPMKSAFLFDMVDMSNINLFPDGVHLFGTDALGRDLWSRVWVGTRISLIIGVAGAILPQIMGFAVGCAAGYCGGWVDLIIMGIVDIGVCVPSLVYVTLVSLWLGSSLFAVVFAIAVSIWMDTARMVRGRIMQYRNREFVLAAQLQGASPFRVIMKHILPNILGHILVSVVAAIPTAIFLEAYLSFIGLGIISPMTSLGQLCKSGSSIFRLYPYQLFIPGAVISLLILAFYILGNCVRDALDPHVRQMMN